MGYIQDPLPPPFKRGNEGDFSSCLALSLGLAAVDPSSQRLRFSHTSGFARNSGLLPSRASRIPRETSTGHVDQRQVRHGGHMWRHDRRSRARRRADPREAAPSRRRPGPPRRSSFPSRPCRGRLIDDPTPGCVDEEGLLLHEGKFPRSDEVMGILHIRNVEGDEVGVPDCLVDGADPTDGKVP